MFFLEMNEKRNPTWLQGLKLRRLTLVSSSFHSRTHVRRVSLRARCWTWSASLSG